MDKRTSDLKPMSPIEFMLRSDLKRHIETATHLRNVKATRSWLRDKELRELSFEDVLVERYDRAPKWFQRVSRILDEHPPSKILTNWRRFAPEFEEREEDFDWADA
ncbi:MAG: hypothetical protein ACE5JG_05245 [Planctomycetota bacterium]